MKKKCYYYFMYLNGRSYLEEEEKRKNNNFRSKTASFMVKDIFGRIIVYLSICLLNFNFWIKIGGKFYGMPS